MWKGKDLYQVSLKLLLKNRSGEILALNHRKSSLFYGFYDVPGGRIHRDEFKVPFPKILKREVREEIGNVKFKTSLIPVAVGRTAVKRPGHKEVRFLFLFFEGKYLGGKIKISTEHTGYAWLNLSKINLKKYFTHGILEGVKMYLET